MVVNTWRGLPSRGSPWPGTAEITGAAGFTAQLDGRERSLLADLARRQLVDGNAGIAGQTRSVRHGAGEPGGLDDAVRIGALTGLVAQI